MVTHVDGSDTANAAGPPTDGTGERSAALALWTFVAILVIAVPVVLLNLGEFHWFFRDDFYFLSGRDGRSLHDLFAPHNVHWSTVPILAFRALYAVFGLRSYIPYQACVLGLHLAVCALLRVIMRRVGVGPWIATVAAASFVFFGPGSQNIIWAFQIGFTGSLAFGLAQIVLGDHDGPIDWRDFVGVAFGLLSLMSSSVGITMAVIVGLAMLGRRGWKVALFHTLPLAVAYSAWWLAERPSLDSAAGRPGVGVLFRWVRSGETGIFMALGHWRVVALLLGAVLVVGLVLAWTRLPRAQLRRRASVPAALLLGGILFSAITGWGRWISGPEFARSSRYLHIGAALALPAIAVAMDAIVRRWRMLLIPVLLLLLVAVPSNIGSFEYPAFGRAYMQERRRIITDITRVPEARQVPRGFRPIPDAFVGPSLTMGWLLQAKAAGRLPSGTTPLPRAERNEMRVRLGVEQGTGSVPTGCRTYRSRVALRPRKGAVIGISQPVSITTRQGTASTSSPVRFDPRDGSKLTAALPGLDLWLAPVGPNRTFTMCSVAPAKEFLVRFFVQQSNAGRLVRCRTISGSIDLNPRKGERYGFDSRIGISTRAGSRSTSPDVVFDPATGHVLTVLAPNLSLRARGVPAGTAFRLCSVA